MSVVVENTPAAWSARASIPAPHEAVGWSEEGQRDRFWAVRDALDLSSDCSIFDFGCGTGAFADLLPASVAYHAYDWAEGMRDRCRRDHPRAIVYDEIPRKTFDHVVAIGPFNLRDNWSKENTAAAVRRLWEMTERTLVVSLYAGDDPRCLTYSLGDALGMLSGLFVGATHVDPHRSNDLLLVVRRPA